MLILPKFLLSEQSYKQENFPDFAECGQVLTESNKREIPDNQTKNKGLNLIFNKVIVIG